MKIYRIHQPNDKLFKKAMEEIEVAKGFFKAHLPKELLKRIDLSTLKLEKETSMNHRYKSFAADVVYSVKFDSQIAYLYTLVENQHEPDEWLPLRILIYLCALLESHRSQKKILPLPPVIPIIFYTGKKSYPFSTSFFDMFGREAALMQQIFTEPFSLIEVHQIADEELRDRTYSGLIEYILKHKQGRNFLKLEELFMWFGELVGNPGWGKAYVQNLVYYVLSETEGKSLEEAMRLAEQYLSGEVKEKTMTYAEQLIEKGRNEGIERGRVEGRQEGRKIGVVDGKLAILIQQLSYKFPDISVTYLEKFHQADESLLSTWAQRMLSAQNCEEIFAD